jgi:hypothetical protein
MFSDGTFPMPERVSVIYDALGGDTFAFLTPQERADVMDQALRLGRTMPPAATFSVEVDETSPAIKLRITHGQAKASAYVGIKSKPNA